MTAITIRALNKSYGDKQVIKNLNLTVPKGSIYGFIGKNGAGKSTTQKMVTGLIHKSSGELKIFGDDVDSDQVRRKIGSLIESPGLFLNMTTYDNIYMHAINLGLKFPKQASNEKLALVGLTEAKNQKAKKLSFGMKQRLGLAMALLGNPKLLVLDEPINGLDPEGIVEFRNVLENLNQSGVTIFISSHILGELSKIATHYGIIRDGVMIAEMTAKELIDKREGYLTIRVPEAQKVLQLLKSNFSIHGSEIVDEEEIRLYHVDDSAAIAQYLVNNGIPLHEIFFEKQDIEQYFLELMGGNE